MVQLGLVFRTDLAQILAKIWIPTFPRKENSKTSDLPNFSLFSHRFPDPITLKQCPRWWKLTRTEREKMHKPQKSDFGAKFKTNQGWYFAMTWKKSLKEFFKLRFCESSKSRGKRSFGQKWSSFEFLPEFAIYLFCNCVPKFFVI